MGSNQGMARFFRFKEVGALASLIVIFTSFGVLNHQFLSAYNLMTIFTVASELGIVTLGVNLVMIAGEFDMSVSSIFALVPILFEILVRSGIPSIISILIVLTFGAAQGFVNGFITTKGHIPSFITTLGTQWFWRGVVLAVTGGYSLTLVKGGNYLNIFGGKIFGMTGVGVRWSAIWFVILTIVFYFVLEWTKYGNKVMASGGSPGTADAMGVQSWKFKTSTFMISGVMAGIAGLAAFSRFQTIDPSLGIQLELQAITAAVIGGTLMTGGYGSAIGAFLGSVILASLSNGLILIGAPTYWYRAFVGVILVAAALFNIRIKKKLVGE